MTRILPLTWWSAGINLAGALAVGYGLARVAPGTAAWVLALAATGLLAWIVRTLIAVVLGERAPDAGRGAQILVAVLLTLMLITGGATAVPTQGAGVAMLIVALLIIVSDPETPLFVCGAAALIGALAVAGGQLFVQAGVAGSAGRFMGVAGLLGVLAGLLLAIVGGFGRRAQRVLVLERERAAAEALQARSTADRVAVARDLHDVLAHSLGALVVQLDAVDALLEAGDARTAATRVADARRLAVEGLREAREAVRSLREPMGPLAGAGSTVPPAELAARLRALLDAYEALGGRVALETTGTARPVPASLAEALVRAGQEGLSNARKHAPGAHVRIRILWHADRVEAIVENRLTDAGTGSALAASGGGHGLRGIRERFAALGGAADARVVRDTEPQTFVLRAEAPA